MENLTGNAVAGLVAALTATTILGLLKLMHLKYMQNREIKQIRDVLTVGRSRVMTAKKTLYRDMDATVHEDLLRSAQYNLMIEQLRVALDHTTSKLPYAKRKEIFDALDWYHTKSLYLTKDEIGNPKFVIDFPVGRWTTREMQESSALEKFKRLESIKWLKLKPYTSENC